MTFSEAAKRIVDFTLALIALVITLPILAVCAVAIKLESPGKVLFQQKRLGRGSRTFEIFKLRTMRTGSADVRNPDGSTLAVADDPRITRIGGFLRKTSLDEIPQLFNVLRGEMSFVGPRPDQADQISYYREKDMARLSVRPGITGWAQISGRNGLSWEQRRDLDLEYIQKRGFWLDMWIMVRTVPAVLFTRGVYAKKEGA